MWGVDPIRHEDFFSLERFRHRDLWKGGMPIWNPLHLLEEYLKAQTFRIEIKVPKTVHLERPELISIGKGTVIEAGVYIQGPCIIGKECVLRHAAYLRGSVICGDHSAIGHGAEVKHSILLDSCAAAHLTYVGDSIIGNGVNLGAGVKCANLRFDKKEIVVSKINTGLRKFGALIGDFSQIGCNSVLNPGTLIGRETICYPLLNFGGIIPPQSLISGSERTKIRIGKAPLFKWVEKVHAP
ncbi:MAG: UDP-N-acetylglucosamine diphosphorylase [Chlamydiae bacterium]|nr:UDP-N-acetylglucosamine diphosphorylase [Chlamydiota bacterium]